MSEAILRSLTLGMGATNCYFLMNKDTKELIIFDPPGEAEKIFAKVAELDAKPVAIFLTHGHYDHITAADAVRVKYQIHIYAHQAESVVLSDDAYNLSAFFGQSSCTVRPDVWLADDEVQSMAGFDIRVLHTPGHTIGSVCYYIESELLLFSGDTLFEHSYGRTDFPTSNPGQMKRSVRRLLDELPMDVEVYPGHGAPTTIRMEKRYNPLA